MSIKTYTGLFYNSTTEKVHSAGNKIIVRGLLNDPSKPTINKTLYPLETWEHMLRDPEWLESLDRRILLGMSGHLPEGKLDQDLVVSTITKIWIDAGLVYCEQEILDNSRGEDLKKMILQNGVKYPWSSRGRGPSKKEGELTILKPGYFLEGVDFVVRPSVSNAKPEYSLEDIENYNYLQESSSRVKSIVESVGDNSDKYQLENILTTIESVKKSHEYLGVDASDFKASIEHVNNLLSNKSKFSKNMDSTQQMIEDLRKRLNSAEAKLESTEKDLKTTNEALISANSKLESQKRLTRKAESDAESAKKEIRRTESLLQSAIESDKTSALKEMTDNYEAAKELLESSLKKMKEMKEMKDDEDDNEDDEDLDAAKKLAEAAIEHCRTLKSENVRLESRLDASRTVIEHQLSTARKYNEAVKKNMISTALKQFPEHKRENVRKVLESTKTADAMKVALENMASLSNVQIDTTLPFVEGAQDSAENLSFRFTGDSTEMKAQMMGLLQDTRAHVTAVNDNIIVVDPGSEDTANLVNLIKSAYRDIELVNAASGNSTTKTESVNYSGVDPLTAAMVKSYKPVTVK